MRKNLASILVLMVAVAAAVSCSSNKDKQPSPLVKKATKVATEMAQQLVATDHSDTLALQNCILEAKAQQAEFQVARDTAAINSFNRAFKKYLQENDPALANEIFTQRPQDLPDDEDWDEFEQFVEDK